MRAESKELELRWAAAAFALLGVAVTLTVFRGLPLLGG
jgi:hypothetical protein